VPADTAFTTVAKIKSQVQSKTMTATDDAILADIAAGMTPAVQRKLGRDILQNTYTVRFNGTGRYAVIMKQTPIVSVTSVLIDGVTIPAAVDAQHAGYIFDQDTIYLSEGGVAVPGFSPSPMGAGRVFRKGIQNCTVVYVAGYSAVPEDIKRAAQIQGAFEYLRRNRQGLKSLAIQGEVTSYMDQEWDPDAEGKLARWVRVPRFGGY